MPKHGLQLHALAELRSARSDLLGAILSTPVHEAVQQGNEQCLHLGLAVAAAPSAGHIIECGVATGRTINHLASLLPYRKIWGFDSFYGLPTEWTRRVEPTVEKGTFSTDGILPKVLPNVQLVQGLFQDTLPIWKETTPGNIAFLHIDCDLYESAKCVLSELNGRMVPGTVVVFDDLSRWEDLPEHPTDWKEQEWLAMEEWLNKYDRDVAVMSRLPNYVVAMRILR